ncbi:MAG TPA: Ig-like domain-containing protein, partial [Pirellulales bacterium]
MLNGYSSPAIDPAGAVYIGSSTQPSLLQFIAAPAPVAQPALFIFNQNPLPGFLHVGAAGGVLGEDENPDPNTTLQAATINGVSVASTGTTVTLASGAQVTLYPDGSFDYDPVAGVHNDSFTYTASNGSQSSNSATVSLVINPMALVPGPQTVVENSSLLFQAVKGNGLNVANVSDEDDVDITLTASNGTLSLSGTSGLSFSSGTGSGDVSMSF